MRARVLLERFTLVVLSALCALSLFGLVAFLAIETLHWAIFPRLGERFFQLALPLLLAALFALSLFDLALNQGIVADRALAAAGELPDARVARTLVLRLGLGLAGFVALSLAVLFLVNRANVREKSRELEAEMQTLCAERRASLDRIVALVEGRAQGHELVRLLSQLASTSPSFRELQVIVPQRRESGVVYQRISRWWGERSPDPFSERAATDYQPNRFELEYLRQAAASGETAPRVFVKRPWLKVFQPLRNARNEAVAFLYSEEHRLGRPDYK
jgi:hypothetical protein